MNERMTLIEAICEGLSCTAPGDEMHTWSSPIELPIPWRVCASESRGERVVFPREVLDCV
jgi:hypothetical protein